MRKFVCPACGLVNLEKFVSFPHCAACGAFLPKTQVSPWRTFWTRPVGMVYLVFAIGSGLAALALGMISLSRETSENAGRPLLVYSSIPRALAPDAVGVMTFTLDSASETPDASFSGVQLRLGRQTLRDVQVVAVQPKPQSIEMRGSGRYYQWVQLPREGKVRLFFKARAPHRLRLRLSLGATRYLPFEVRSTLQVAPESGQGAAGVSK